MKMPKRVVETYIAYHPRDLTRATHNLLNHYITIYHRNDRSAAYTGLCTALKHRDVKLTYLIKEVLDEKETGTGGVPEGKGVNKYTRMIQTSNPVRVTTVQNRPRH